ncbi:RNA 3'-terminal phosphate cyclase [Massilia pseudoviolaceinigra]|uniref:RNA 3'-terminal phosphate cyclase n=1 Tax=Massilia pseudoviolaceinigra TaxID=3057165 RepID=UPI0027967A9B|nr:RNA 3'-terminal phosphate cyclase [Massilia sp. CCM 9206]MDQ1924389.1 RNA 3'-terminal phosphate cyclase [Massilia sp. CCM 9206]
MIELDGAVGEGGGQILRSALTLSMITGQAFCIKNIRAGRKKPGLLRQHLVAVQAATQISGATVTGAELGSQTLVFAPKAIKGGDYQFAIGSAGSCTLVLQTVLLALLHADGPSTVRVSGGTHNPMAPPAQFLQRAYIPLLRKMGADIDIELLRSGFYPAGGGCIVATIAPCPQLQQLTLMERGERVGGYAEGIVAGLPASIALRELECVGLGMNWTGDQLRMRGLPGEQGPGNALLITLEYESATEVFCAFGEKMVRAETVAKDAMHEARRYIASQAAVGEHLADQLMLPMALAGGGSFTADVISQHAITNAEVIGRFLAVAIMLEAGEQRSTCTVRATA